MDASQYKDYVLTLLFVKYVSDKYAGDPFATIVVPDGGSFADMVRLKGDEEIGDKMNKIIAKLAEANHLRGVIDQADFNDEAKLGRGKEMVDRLSKLVAIFEGIDLRANRAEGDDLLGDAYEYLMRHFATESGKSKGQFYTPAEVSRVMARIVGAGQATSQTQTVYDPTCGSGSLLIKVADESPRGLTIYGQEMDNATAALARMNMILHGHPDAEIWQGNTLAAPHWVNPDGSLKTFDFVVANPPFSQKNWTNGVNTEKDPYGRFEYGTPPASNGDYAFLLHILKSLKSTGKAAVILPHGVLFRGNAEANIRRELVRRGFIKGVIGLPPNLFYGTGIPACIIVLDKENAHVRRGILMIDASKGFRKDGNKNRLREQDIHKIVDTFNEAREIPGYSRMVPLAEIEANDYNLNIPRYIDSGEAEDRQDLGGHLYGGIPARDVDALAAYWQVLPNLRQALFAPLRPGYLAVQVAPRQVRPTILAHPDFAAFRAQARAPFDAWRQAHRPRLLSLSRDEHPKPLIRELADDLLARYAGVPLLDPYDLYQRLMDYWNETMQDDVYLILGEGWQEAARPRPLTAARNGQESPDLTVNKKKFKMDLLPPDLLARRFFPDRLARLTDLQAEAESAAAELDAFVEENSGDEGLLADALTEAGKATKSGLTARLKEIWGQPDFADEEAALRRTLALMEAKSQADKALKAAQKALDEAVLQKYAALSEADIQTLTVDDKWLAALEAAVTEEVARIAQRLAARVAELAERYADPLPQIEQEVADLRARVEEHLRQMGVLE
ncbi:MAG: type I restriction-modification system subunit M [Anaerolineae bacterium]